MITDDHYTILGLDEYKIIATPDQIKAAYRKLALTYHPDKGSASSVKIADEKAKASHDEVNKQIWLKIQKAYETLMDDTKKKTFDSSLPFDDTYPE